MDVRCRGRLVKDGNDAGVDGPGAVEVQPGREWIPLLSAAVVTRTRLSKSSHISEMTCIAHHCAS